MGLVYLPSITMVNLYFDRKRGLFAGVVTSGSGIGLLVLSHLTDLLIGEYGWRGCYFVIAGILLNLCVCASLMRPLEDNYRLRPRSRSSSSSNSAPVTEESEKDTKGTVCYKLPSVTTNKPRNAASVDNWVASQPLLPSEQTDGKLKHQSKQPSTSNQISQFVSLPRLVQEGLGDGQTERTTKGERSQSLSVQLDCDATPFEHIGHSKTPNQGYLDKGTSVVLSTANTNESAYEEGDVNFNSDDKTYRTCQYSNDKTCHVIVKNDSHATVTAPDIVVDGEDVFRHGHATQTTYSVPYSKPVVCEVDEQTAPPVFHSQNGLSNYSLAHHHGNYNNHSHHQRVHHSNSHGHHSQWSRDSHSTLHDAAETESVVSGRPILHKSDLLNILPEFIGSLSTLSVNTVHSGLLSQTRGSMHSLRSSLLHRRASRASAASKMDSQTSLSMGSKHTLPAGFPLDFNGKDCNNLEEGDVQEEQVRVCFSIHDV
ncbi:monocarboxylate transporter 12 [Elysia marginata]|uniref:Monocarboxylate transporter 12 n=1 Tax=Elysia marginata TaxID=1093978 RepID=A0AAV4GBV5_9GAST|nr:monocarboxylate transporter 12 [Elysia marginata]